MLKTDAATSYYALLHARADDTGYAYYFSHRDFPGLRCAPYPFVSSAGHSLQGYFYCYDRPRQGHVVIFDHGMGSGHRGYMKEIERLCRHGYTVFAYDHTGCMESGGEDTGGFAQSLHDLDDALKTLKADKAYADCTFSVMGHSWGGFSTMNIGALHPDICHQIALAGFVSVEAILHQMLRDKESNRFRLAYGIETEANPFYVNFDACESLAKTNAKVLLIYSEDDPTVVAEYHLNVLAEGVKALSHVRLLRTTGKGHNPNYTKDAVAYKDLFFKEYTKQLRRPTLQPAEFIKRWDWERMTAQDDAIWDEIFKTLDS